MSCPREKALLLFAVCNIYLFVPAAFPCDSDFIDNEGYYDIPSPLLFLDDVDALVNSKLCHDHGLPLHGVLVMEQRLDDLTRHILAILRKHTIMAASNGRQRDDWLRAIPAAHGCVSPKLKRVLQFLLPPRPIDS